jgi:hypothetical protein
MTGNVAVRNGRSFGWTGAMVALAMAARVSARWQGYCAGSYPGLR